MANVYYGANYQPVPDGNWNNAANWYSDPGFFCCCTGFAGTPLGRVPSIALSDDVVLFSGVVSTGPSGGWSRSVAFAGLSGGTGNPTIAAGTYSGVITFEYAYGSISGGTFTNTTTIDVGNQGVTPNNAEVNISGGTFSSKVIVGKTPGGYFGRITGGTFLGDLDIYYGEINGGTVAGNIGIYNPVAIAPVWALRNITVTGNVNMTATNASYNLGYTTRCYMKNCVIAGLTTLTSQGIGSPTTGVPDSFANGIIDNCDFNGGLVVSRYIAGTAHGFIYNNCRVRGVPFNSGGKIGPGSLGAGI